MTIDTKLRWIENRCKYSVTAHVNRQQSSCTRQSNDNEDTSESQVQLLCPLELQAQSINCWVNTWTNSTVVCNVLVNCTSLERERNKSKWNDAKWITHHSGWWKISNTLRKADESATNHSWKRMREREINKQSIESPTERRRRDKLNGDSTAVTRIRDSRASEMHWRTNSGSEISREWNEIWNAFNRVAEREREKERTKVSDKWQSARRQAKK